MGAEASQRLLTANRPSRIVGRGEGLLRRSFARRSSCSTEWEAKEKKAGQFSCFRGKGNKSPTSSGDIIGERFGREPKVKGPLTALKLIQRFTMFRLQPDWSGKQRHINLPRQA